MGYSKTTCTHGAKFKVAIVRYNFGVNKSSPKTCVARETALKHYVAKQSDKQ